MSAAVDVDRPYTYDDLSNAVRDYDHARAKHKGCMDLVSSAKKAMESHQRDADLAAQEIDRFKAQIRKIVAKLEK